MKKYLMNKNVEHNGKMYAKGSEIQEGDDGFEEIVKKGHAQVLDLKDGEASPKMEEPKSNWKEAQPDKESVEQKQPANKSKK